MSDRAITQDDLARARDGGDSRQAIPKVSTILGTIALTVTMGTLIWGMATVVSSKADKETVHRIQIDVEVIKTQQEMFIRAVRPGLLPIGKE